MTPNFYTCATRGPIPDWASQEAITAPLHMRAAALPAPPELNIVWKGTDNRWIGRGGQPVLAICDHIMQSSIESADDWFRNPASEASAHFGVARDGRIWQWVALENTAWTNGIINKPDMSVDWIARCVTQKLNPNTYTIGIEHEGMSGQPMPEKQFQTTLALHKWLIQQYGIPLDRAHIIGHYQIDSVNRAGCPGTGFLFGRLLDSLKKDLSTLPFDPNPNNFAVGPGMLAKLTDAGLQAGSNEMYFTPEPGQPGLGKFSHLYTKTPGIKLEAFQELDENGNPTGVWDVRTFKQLD